MVDANSEPVGGVLVLIDDDGYLSLLEVFAYEGRISPMPAPHELKFGLTRTLE